MTAIMECPSCGAMLKEYGDDMKTHEYTYNVYNVEDGEEPDGIFRIIQCNYCGYAGSTNDFPD